MLINLSNHPSSNWSVHQIAEANRLYGGIIDLPFPQVDPQADVNAINDLATRYVAQITALSEGHPAAIHLMGEMTLTFALVKKLQQAGHSCVASTTQRIVNELPDGRKEVLFQFVRFRNYPQL